MQCRFFSFTGVLFNSATVTTEVRFNLHSSNHNTASFWAGLLIIISALLTLLSLISTFTAWAMVSAIDGKNAHCILRSSIGQYAAELPGRLVVFSIYSFLTSFMLFFFLLLPVGFWSILLLVSTAVLFIHVISVFSCFGRIIMHTGAMGNSRIFSPDYEGFLEPHSLHTNLRNKAECNLAHSTSIMRQYRSRQQPIDRYLANDQEMHDHLSGMNVVDHRHRPNSMINRPRTDSIVRFADEEQGLVGDGTGGNGTASERSKSEILDNSDTHHFKYGSFAASDPFRSNLTPLSENSNSSHRSSSFSDLAVEDAVALDPVVAKTPAITTTSYPRGGLERPPSTIFTDTTSSKNDSVPPPLPAMPAKPTAVNWNLGRHTSNISSVSNLSNVSTASLEQWLQGSSPRYKRPDIQVSGNGGGGNSTRSNGSISVNDGNHASPSSVVEDGAATRVEPPSSFASSGPQRPSAAASKMAKPPAIELATDDLVLPPSSRSARNMSESEQFEYDYGDIQEDDASSPELDGSGYHEPDDRNGRHSDKATNFNVLNDNTQVIPATDDDESTSLLANSKVNNNNKKTGHS